MEDKIKCLEAFLMDIDQLDSITVRLADFNAFETLGLVNNEIRHSNVLAWLMNPNENHGIGDLFLRKILQTAYQAQCDMKKHQSLSLIELSLMDCEDFILRREWKNIDILAVSQKNKVVVCIENKIWSDEGKNQLKKYKQIIDTEYPDYRALFIFLTPDGAEPSDVHNWIIMNYSVVKSHIEKCLEQKRGALNNQIADFLGQYVQMVRRHIVRDEEMERICRDIYYKHRKALDLIYEYKPDVFSDISSALEGMLEEYDEVVVDRCTKNFVRFTTKKLDSSIPKEGDGWTNTKRILLYEIQLKNDSIQVKLIVGPGNSSWREKLYGAAVANKYGQFKGTLSTLTGKWTQIFSKELMPKGYYEKHNEDLESIMAELKKQFDSFYETDVLTQEKVLSDLS